MAYQINPFTGKFDITPFSLDGAGKIPSDYLPSYVDDVVEHDDLASFPGTGETGKIYVAKDTGYTYRWTGSVYVRIGSGGDVALNLGSAASPSLYFTGDTNTGIYSPGADQLALSTNGTGRLFIDSSGNVGIGASSPYVFTQIEGQLMATGSADQFASEQKVLIFGRKGRSSLDRHNYISSVVNFTTGNDNKLLFYVDDSSGTSHVNPLTLTGAGRVGIGDTGPSETLTVKGASGVDPFSVSGPSSEFIRVDDDGRLLVGTSSALTDRKIFVNRPSTLGILQPSGESGLVIITNQTSATDSVGGRISLQRFVGVSTVVLNDDELGSIAFGGGTGDGATTDRNAAQISCEVDGTPGSEDMPGRLVFSVTADGAFSPTEAMRINNARELLVGYTSDNGAYKLQVNSQIFATSATIATSDGRYKENVATLDGCVDLVKALRPVSFDWKHQEPITRVDEEGETVVVREAHNFPDGTQVGFIAQEVETVLADKPWLGSVIKQNVRPAVTDNDGNELAPEEEFLGIAEGNLVAVLTSALKDAIGRIESLEAEVAALKA